MDSLARRRLEEERSEGSKTLGSRLIFVVKEAYRRIVVVEVVEVVQNLDDRLDPDGSTPFDFRGDDVIARQNTRKVPCRFSPAMIDK